MAIYLSNREGVDISRPSGGCMLYCSDKLLHSLPCGVAEPCFFLFAATLVGSCSALAPKPRAWHAPSGSSRR